MDDVENQAADRKVNLCLLPCYEMKVKDGLVYDINTSRLIVRFWELVSILELLGLSHNFRPAINVMVNLGHESGLVL